MIFYYPNKYHIDESFWFAAMTSYIHTYNLYLYTIKMSKLTSLWARVLRRYTKKLQLKDKNNSYKRYF